MDMSLRCGYVMLGTFLVMLGIITALITASFF
jgi:hypothetical protein